MASLSEVIMRRAWCFGETSAFQIGKVDISISVTQDNPGDTEPTIQFLSTVDSREKL